MASRQLNLRFDEQHHDVVRRVVDRLRRDSSFLASLEALLGSDSALTGDGSAPETLERLGRLERRVDVLENCVEVQEMAPGHHRRDPLERLLVPLAPPSAMLTLTKLPAPGPSATS